MEMDDRRPRVVVLHALRPTSRTTTITHLTSFRRHLPDADVRYLHFAQPLPPDLDIPSVDLLVVNYDFLNYRFTPLWPFIKDRWITLARQAAVRVAIPQDDFWASRLLDKWCERWQIDRVLTPLDGELELIYPRTIRRAEFETVLTGYLDESIDAGVPIRERPIDLGQRVRRMPPHLGRYAQEKSAQAIKLAEIARAAGFIVDVSDNNEDAFLGESWFDFLRSCRFTVGMKGGASRIDPWGLEYLRARRYLARRSDADFEEVVARAIRGKEVAEMTAMSPRLLESAATGTCQILPPSDYLGVLEPWRHYLPLERDFANVNTVIDRMRDVDSAQQIATAAREVLVESGQFTDAALVTAATQGFSPKASESPADDAWARFVEVLEFSSAVCSHDGPIVHDAVQEAIRWMVDRRQTQESAERLARMARDPEALGLSMVLRYIRDSDRGVWFRTIVEWSRKESSFRRSPWSWRPV